jgi:hypothetical protein
MLNVTGLNTPIRRQRLILGVIPRTQTLKVKSFVNMRTVSCLQVGHDDLSFSKMTGAFALFHGPDFSTAQKTVQHFLYLLP